MSHHVHVNLDADWSSTLQRICVERGLELVCQHTGSLYHSLKDRLGYSYCTVCKQIVSNNGEVITQTDYQYLMMREFVVGEYGL